MIRYLMKEFFSPNTKLIAFAEGHTQSTFECTRTYVKPTHTKSHSDNVCSDKRSFVVKGKIRPQSGSKCQTMFPFLPDKSGPCSHSEVLFL